MLAAATHTDEKAAKRRNASREMWWLLPRSRAESSNNLPVALSRPATKREDDAGEGISASVHGLSCSKSPGLHVPVPSCPASSDSGAVYKQWTGGGSVRRRDQGGPSDEKRVHIPRDMNPHVSEEEHVP
jgi:hypothetical protein